MKKFIRAATLTLICLTLFNSNTFSQKKLIKKLFSNEPDTTRAPSFLPVPLLGYSQESGFEIGAIALYSFYTDRKDTLTRNSAITGLASITTEKQSSFFLKTDIWTPQNKLHYISEFRYKNFPFNFYGIGNDTREIDEDPITQKLFRLSAGVEKKFGKSSFSGINVLYENYNYEDPETGGIFETGAGIRDRDGGQILSLGISQIFDNRNSNTYATKGHYLRLLYAYAPDLFGGENFKGSLFETDLRVFKPLSRVFTVGLNGLYNSIRGNNVPFYLFPQLGNDEMLRGYYSGRFRQETLLAMQSEIRYRPLPRFGLVAFAGTGAVFARKEFKFQNLKPNYGAGFRYFFDTEKGLSVRIDYGIGEKRPGEERQSGFYLSLGEAF